MVTVALALLLGYRVSWAVSRSCREAVLISQTFIMKFNCYDSSVLMSLTKYIFIYMDPYRVAGSHIFPQKSLINDGNVPSVWNHSKEGWGCIVTNDSVLNSPLKLPTFHANQIHVS